MCKLFSSRLGINCSVLVGEAARLSTTLVHKRSKRPLSARSRDCRLTTQISYSYLLAHSPTPQVSTLKETQTAAHSMINHPHQCVPHRSILPLFHLRIHHPLPRPVNPIPSLTSTFGNGFPSAEGVGRKPTQTR